MLTGKIEAEVRSFIVANYMFGQGERLQDGQSLLESGHIDSTGVLELVSHIEEKYGLKVADEELIPENLDSVTAISHYIRRKLAAAVSPAVTESAISACAARG